MFKILFLILFLTPAMLKAEFSSTIHAGLSYINSKSLNIITQGFNEKYGTDFTNINLPYSFAISVDYKYERLGFGLSGGYEFSSKQSTSDFVEVDGTRIQQTLKFSSIPSSLYMTYDFVSNYVFKMSVLLGGGYTYNLLYLKNSPQVDQTTEQANSMYAPGYLVNTGLRFELRNSGNVSFLCTTLFDYSKTSNFKYRADSAEHVKGDQVLFEDGSALTLNLTGLKFLLGIKFIWSE